MTARLQLSLTGHGEVSLEQGEALLVLGPATELLEVLLGSRGAGRAVLDGRPLRGRLARRVSAGLGVVRDVPVAADVSVLDHLAARVGTERAAELVEQAPLLSGRGHDPAGVLSGGERTVLAWLRALATRPRVLLLDRAGVGLDQAALAWAGATVERMREDGVVVVVAPGRDEERAWASPGRTVTMPG